MDWELVRINPDGSEERVGLYKGPSADRDALGDAMVENRRADEAEGRYEARAVTEEDADTRAA